MAVTFDSLNGNLLGVNAQPLKEGPWLQTVELTLIRLERQFVPLEILELKNSD